MNNYPIRLFPANAQVLKYLCLFIFFCANAMANEEAKYTVVQQNDVYEIRHYENRLVAQVSYSGENSGFRTLFNYISGDNTAQQDIAMTVPVTQSVKIDMTTPVTQIDAGSTKIMQFYMPSQFTEDTVPQPTNPAVEIRTVKGGHFAVIRYSGRASDGNFNKHAAILETALNKDGLAFSNPPIKATYNSPFTLPFMRRNEAMFRVEWE